jgi:hypothetical protein
MIRGDLALSYRSAGRTSDAIVLLEQVLADSQRLLGAEHPNTLLVRANLDELITAGADMQSGPC